MNIKEYSEGVLGDMHKAHDEIMFLYDMLSGKQEELEKSISEAKELDKGLIESAKAVKETDMQHKAVKPAASGGIFEREAHIVDVSNELEEMSLNAFSSDIDMATDDGKETQKAEEIQKVQDITAGNERDNNAKIIEYHKRGWSEKDIAIALGIGMGEVKLAVNLYESRR